MDENEFNSLIAKIDQDGDSQHGPSMIDVEKIIAHARALRAALLWTSEDIDGAAQKADWNRRCRHLFTT